MIIVTLMPGDRYLISEDIWQYDRGQVLCITGLPRLEGDVWFQYSPNESSGETRGVLAEVTADGYVAPIPNDMLENKNALHVFVCQRGVSSGQTICRIALPVIARPRPVPSQPQD